MKKIIKIQFFVLFIGTIFAWTNFILELFAWLNQQACTTGCSIVSPVANPFFTPCFYGAIFFLLAFILNLLLIFATREKKVKTEKQIEITEKKEDAEKINSQGV